LTLPRECDRPPDDADVARWIITTLLAKRRRDDTLSGRGYFCVPKAIPAAEACDAYGRRARATTNMARREIGTFGSFALSCANFLG